MPCLAWVVLGDSEVDIRQPDTTHDPFLLVDVFGITSRPLLEAVLPSSLSKLVQAVCGYVGCAFVGLKDYLESERPLTFIDALVAAELVAVNVKPPAVRETLVNAVVVVVAHCIVPRKII